MQRKGDPSPGMATLRQPRYAAFVADEHQISCILSPHAEARRKTLPDYEANKCFT